MDRRLVGTESSSRLFEFGFGARASDIQTNNVTVALGVVVPGLTNPNSIGHHDCLSSNVVLYSTVVLMFESPSS